MALNRNNFLVNPGDPISPDTTNNLLHDIAKNTQNYAPEAFASIGTWGGTFLTSYYDYTQNQQPNKIPLFTVRIGPLDKSVEAQDDGEMYIKVWNPDATKNLTYSTYTEPWQSNLWTNSFLRSGSMTFFTNRDGTEWDFERMIVNQAGAYTGWIYLKTPVSAIAKDYVYIYAGFHPTTLQLGECTEPSLINLSVAWTLYDLNDTWYMDQMDAHAWLMSIQGYPYLLDDPDTLPGPEYEAWIEQAAPKLIAILNRENFGTAQKPDYRWNIEQMWTGVIDTDPHTDDTPLFLFDEIGSMYCGKIYGLSIQKSPNYRYYGLLNFTTDSQTASLGEYNPKTKWNYLCECQWLDVFPWDCDGRDRANAVDLIFKTNLAADCDTTCERWLRYSNIYDVKAMLVPTLDDDYSQLPCCCRHTLPCFNQHSLEWICRCVDTNLYLQELYHFQYSSCYTEAAWCEVTCRCIDNWHFLVRDTDPNENLHKNELRYVDMTGIFGDICEQIGCLWCSIGQDPQDWWDCCGHDQADCCYWIKGEGADENYGYTIGDSSKNAVINLDCRQLECCGWSTEYDFTVQTDLTVCEKTILMGDVVFGCATTCGDCVISNAQGSHFEFNCTGSCNWNYFDKLCACFLYAGDFHGERVCIENLTVDTSFNAACIDATWGHFENLDAQDASFLNLTAYSTFSLGGNQVTTTDLTYVSSVEVDSEGKVTCVRYGCMTVLTI